MGNLVELGYPFHIRIIELQRWREVQESLDTTPCQSTANTSLTGDHLTSVWNPLKKEIPPPFKEIHSPVKQVHITVRKFFLKFKLNLLSHDLNPLPQVLPSECTNNQACSVFHRELHLIYDSKYLKMAIVSLLGLLFSRQKIPSFFNYSSSPYLWLTFPYRGQSYLQQRYRWQQIIQTQSFSLQVQLPPFGSQLSHLTRI